MHIPITCVALHLIHSTSAEELLSDPRAHTRPLNLYTHAEEEQQKKQQLQQKFTSLVLHGKYEKNDNNTRREREIVLT